MYLLRGFMFHSESGTAQGNHGSARLLWNMMFVHSDLIPWTATCSKKWQSASVLNTHTEEILIYQTWADQMFGQFCFYLTVVPIILQVNSFVVMAFLITFLAMLVCKHASLFFYSFQTMYPDDFGDSFMFLLAQSAGWHCWLLLNDCCEICYNHVPLKINCINFDPL